MGCERVFSHLGAIITGSFGFVGLGNMGGPMAQNLLKAGHALRVYDLAPAALDAAKAAGASRPDRARDRATRAAGRRMGGIEAPARNKRKHFFLMNPGPGGPSSNRPQKQPGTDSSPAGPGLARQELLEQQRVARNQLGRVAQAHHERDRQPRRSSLREYLRLLRQDEDEYELLLRSIEQV